MGKIDTSGDAQLPSTTHSNDANKQAANLINWHQEYDQLSHGSFLGLIREVNFNHVHVFREDTNRALRQQCMVEEGGLWLGFSADNKSCRINNRATNRSQILCRPGSRNFELITPEKFSIYGLVLHKSMFQQASIQNQREIPKSLPDSLWLEGIPAHCITNFRQYLSILLQPERARWSNRTQEAILQDAIIELLSNSITNKPRKAPNSQRLRTMERVKSYLASTDLKSPVTIGEICEAVHISRRTLQYTFTSCCDMSPKQFIRLTRLNQIRRALQNPEENRTISDIAFDFGFFHLGQFGHDYKLLFGETPLNTIKRSR